MTINNEQKRIKELDVWNLPNIVVDGSGWEQKIIPEATSRNMFIFMNKINELIEVVNDLENKNRELVKILQNKNVIKKE